MLFENFHCRCDEVSAKKLITLCFLSLFCHNRFDIIQLSRERKTKLSLENITKGDFTMKKENANKKMKITAIIMAAAMVLSASLALTGCSNGNSAEGSATTTTATTAATSAPAAVSTTDDERAAVAEAVTNAANNEVVNADDNQQDVQTPDNNTDVQDNNVEESERQFTIAIINNTTGESVSVVAENATDRYDTVSAYFRDLTPGEYNVAVYTLNIAGGNTSRCASTSFDCSDAEGPTNVRINFYPVVSEAEVFFTE